MNLITAGLWEIDEIGSGVHCYLWEWHAGYTLIDTGMPSHARTVLEALIAAKIPFHAVRRIIITHSDLDHSGGLAQLRRATQARVVCHAVEKEFLEHPARRLPTPILMKGLFRVMCVLPSFSQRPVTPDDLVVDGQELPEGFTVVHTPGHTPGHISLVHRERRLLIAGDAMSNRGGKLRAPLGVYTPDMVNAQRSIWRLAKKYGDEIEIAVFGHGPPIPSNGGKRIKALVSQIFSAEV
jgi:glyoxylase-like metal-dependent hydrolase (beta-lactamase superfamily II)